MNQVISIQYLRALAAFLVVLYHIAFLVPIGEFIFPQGRIGVDIFFVISGFVMWVTCQTPDPANFLIRRIIRIVPLYWCATLYFAMVSFSNGLEIGFNATLESFLKSLFFIPFENADRGGRIVPVAGVGWTLNLEIMFYLIFAAALWVERSRRILIVFAVFASLAMLSQIMGAEYRILAFVADGIIFEFVAGMVLGLLYERGLIPVRRSIPVWAVAYLTFTLTWGAFASDIRFVDLGLPSIVLVYFVLGFEGRLAARPSPSLLLLGSASYALYLSHKAVLEAFFALSFHLTWLKNPLIFWPAVTMACLVSAVVVYKVFEEPVTAQLRKVQKSGRNAVAA